jgi:SIR2-like domain
MSESLAPDGLDDVPATVSAEMEAHLDNLVMAFRGGRDVVPFLGAGVNVFERPPDVRWEPGQRQFLPDAKELAQHLTTQFHWPTEGDKGDLLRVSQYIAATAGTGPLYHELHSVFDANYEPSSLHRLLAALPELLERITGTRRYQLILTTNYDDGLERAFEGAGEDIDVVSYMADDHKNHGRFLHRRRGEAPKTIRTPNNYVDVTRERRTVILKLHGAIDRDRPPQVEDSYVITEDHYVDYLTQTDVGKLVPINLAAELQDSHVLFLGYGMADWNLRVLLHRMWGRRRLKYKSWSIQHKTSPLDKAVWEQRNLDLLEMDLRQYVPLLRKRIEALLSAES